MSKEFEVSLNDVNEGLNTEEIPSLADFADDVGGPWANGWYKAEVVEGYTTRKGKVIQTDDTQSSKGDSRNLKLAFRVVDSKGNERFIMENINYRNSDFTKARISYIKEMREEYKGVKGRWADGDAQRTSLALARLGALEKIAGAIKRTAEGVAAFQFVGKRLDVRLGTDDNGYNVITAFAPSGTKAKS